MNHYNLLIKWSDGGIYEQHFPSLPTEILSIAIDKIAQIKKMAPNAVVIKLELRLIP